MAQLRELFPQMSELALRRSLLQSASLEAAIESLLEGLGEGDGLAIGTITSTTNTEGDTSKVISKKADAASFDERLRDSFRAFS